MQPNPPSPNTSGPHCRSYRVVQWGTGTIGRHALRAVIEHPDLTLVGLHVHTPEKLGRDAGDLCGIGATGVTASGDIEDIAAVRADCVLYMPLVFDLDDVCRLLATGVNIVTTCGQFHHPASMEAALRSRVEDACETGGASVHSTGSSPGFISEALPLVLTSIQRRLDSLVIDEYADLSQRDSPQLILDLMGFGRAAAPFEDFRADYLRSSFGPSLKLVADAIRLPLDSVHASGELATTANDLRIAAGSLAAGSVAAQRVTVAGMRGGHPLLTFRATWYCTTELEPHWDLHPTGWHVVVDGDAPLDITMRMPIPLNQMPSVAPGYTANRAVNLVAAVCDAAPGIRTTDELPVALSNLGARRRL